MLSPLHILVIEDMASDYLLLARSLSHGEIPVETRHVGNVDELNEALEDRHWDVVLCDYSIPGLSFEDAFHLIRRRQPEVPVIVVSGSLMDEDAVDLLRLGASDFVLKPFRVDQIVNSINRCFERARLARENFVLRRQLEERGGARDEIVGHSDSIARLRALVRRVAPTPSTVLIQGESGVGKELVARALHQLSPRAEGPFVAVNCAAISADLIESELFGHVKGAFTGAKDNRNGLFYYAHGGTIFLDEIGETSPAFQVKLLRVLQEGEFRPLGSPRPVTVDVRVIAATNQELAAEVNAGRFRADLFYRLEVLTLNIAPLRNRVSDIRLLTEHFLAYYTLQLGLPRLDVTPAVAEVTTPVGLPEPSPTTYAVSSSTPIRLANSARM